MVLGEFQHGIPVGDPRVVNKNMDTSEPLDCVGNHRANGIPRRKIEDTGLNAVWSGAFLPYLGEALCAPANRQNPCALGGKCVDDGAARICRTLNTNGEAAARKRPHRERRDLGAVAPVKRSGYQRPR
jgi:hypothetical protein